MGPSEGVADGRRLIGTLEGVADGIVVEISFEGISKLIFKCISRSRDGYFVIRDKNFYCRSCDR